jgi:hypothetical protein
VDPNPAPPMFTFSPQLMAVGWANAMLPIINTMPITTMGIKSRFKIIGFLSL